MAHAQTSRSAAVEIQVDAGATLGPVNPFWNWFGYDEPNYTYADNGKKLLHELAAMNPNRKVYARTHNLFTTGDGSRSPKWGSTNCYTEDAQGKPVYDWKIIDQIFDAYRDAKVTPLVELGFMPEALSTKPQPYRHTFPKGDLFLGWAHPPTDFGKWEELVRQFTLHLIERYGKEEVQGWPFQVWNEPDIGYWRGTTEEFYTLYDHSAKALKSVLPDARIGGPEMTGPYGDKGAKYLRAFFAHCETGQNAATGGVGSPLDFVSFHPKGSPKFVDGHVRMGLSNHLAAIDNGFATVAASEKYHTLPIIMGESDPEGCAACPAKNNPGNAYRDGPLYASYTAAMLAKTEELADKHHVRVEGSVTWAFEFEDSPFFAGLRELATNGVDKAVLNTFRMYDRLEGNRLVVKSSANLDAAAILKGGVRKEPDVSAVASLEGKKLTIIVWNYHDDDVAADAAEVTVAVAHLPKDASAVKTNACRVDETHSNAFAVFKAMGSPQPPTKQQYAEIEKAGQLQPLEPAPACDVIDGSATIKLTAPRQSVTLIELSWN